MNSIDPPTQTRGSDAVDVQPLDELIGEFGDDYVLLDMVAQGGMGVVFRARQKSLDRIVALKMILSGQLATEEEVQRFQLEAQAAAKLDHPGIVPVYQTGEFHGQYYFTMGFVEGESLSDRIKEYPLPQREAAVIALKVADAIAYAHDQGVVHRDIKPANILLDHQDEPRLTDFGLAKTQSDSNLTVQGQILGTPYYMPPEQAWGEVEAVGPQSDVYSVGAVLYAMLTGRPPFQAPNVIATITAVKEQQPVPLRRLVPNVHPELETICLKCLEKEPDDRYADAQALARDIKSYLNDEPIEARPLGVIQTAWRWYTGQRESARWVAGGYAMIIGLILLCWNLMGVFAVLLQDRYAEVRMRALAEILAGIVTSTTPTIIVGYVTVRRLRWSLHFGLAVMLGATCFTGATYFGVISLVSVQTEPFDPVGALLGIISVIGFALFIVAYYAYQRQARKASRESTIAQAPTKHGSGESVTSPMPRSTMRSRS